jgi:ABC-type nitrate/sulfonate/bicarbonate transport system substrate-binding protein
MTLSLRNLALTTALGLAFAGTAQAEVTIRYLASHGGLSAHELAQELGYFEGTGITLKTWAMPAAGRNR